MVFYWDQPFEMVFFPIEHDKTQPNQPKRLIPMEHPSLQVCSTERPETDAC